MGGWRVAWKTTAVVRCPRLRRLSFETLEPLLPLSAAGWDADYEQWRRQTFTVDGLEAVDVPLDLSSISADTHSAVGQASQSLQLIGGDHVQQQYGYTGAGYTVAILDTGIDYTHPALAASYIGGWDFVDNDPDPMDRHGHGTHVAGIIASSDGNSPGVAPDVNIISLRVLGTGGVGSFGDIEAALRWVARHQAQYNIVAVNMSLGSGNFSANPWVYLEDELATIEAQGVFVAAASGNSFFAHDSRPGLGFPAISSRTVSVGAVWSGNFGSVSFSSGGRDYVTAADHLTSFTQRSAALDVLAPGGFIKSTYLGGGWRSLAGTSMAAPVVAGGAVLVHQAMDVAGLGHLANQDSILQIMQATGVSIVDGDNEQDNVTNTWMTFSRLDVAAAVASIGSQINVQPTADSRDVQLFVTAVYQELLGRSPEAAGLDYWTHQIQTGVSRTTVASAIWTSAEFQSKQVDAYYAEFLHRTPRAGERAYWTDVLVQSTSDLPVPRAFLASQEYAALYPDGPEFVDAVYHDVLGRAADADGKEFWSLFLESGGGRAYVAETFLTSDEFRLGEIDGYYERFLGRTPAAKERNWWLAQITSGATALRSIGERFLGSDEYLAMTTAAAGTTAATSAVSAAALSPSATATEQFPFVPIFPAEPNAIERTEPIATRSGDTHGSSDAVAIDRASLSDPTGATAWQPIQTTHDLHSPNLPRRTRGVDVPSVETVAQALEEWFAMPPEWR